MKFTLILIKVLFFTSFSLQAQTRLGFVEYCMEHSIAAKHFGKNSVLMVDNDSLFNEVVKSINKGKIGNINFKDSILIGFNLFTDCKATINKEVFCNDSLKKYILKLKIYDGGCRGMIWQGFWLIIPKNKSNYALFTEQTYYRTHLTRKIVHKLI